MSDIKITLTVDVKRLQDLLTSAIEGGSNYWASFDRVEHSGDMGAYVKVWLTEHEASDSRKEPIVRDVTAEDLAKGLQALADVTSDPDKLSEFPAAFKHLNNALDDYDQETADVVLQMTVFGELVYG